MSKENDRNDDRGKPYERKIPKRDIRLLQRQLLNGRLHGKNCDRHNVKKQSESDQVPRDQDRFVRFAASESQKVNYRRRKAGKDVEVSTFECHYLRNLS